MGHRKISKEEALLSIKDGIVETFSEYAVKIWIYWHSFDRYALVHLIIAFLLFMLYVKGGQKIYLHYQMTTKKNN